MNIIVIFFVGVVVSGLITLIKPYWVLPIFILGHFVEPVHWFPELRPYYPGLTVGITVLSFWLIHILIYGDAIRARSAQVTLVWLLIITMILATIFSDNSNSTVTIIYLRVLIPYFIFLYFITTRSQVIGVVWMLLIFGVIASIYGIYCSKMNIGASYGNYRRIMSFFDNPNMFGETMTLLIPFAMAFLFLKSPKRIKLIVLATLAFLLIGLVLSYSRKCFFGLIVAQVMFVWKYFKGAEKKITGIIGLVMAMLMVYAIFPDTAKWRFTSRVQGIFEAESAESLDAGRTETTKAGFVMLLQNPLLGVGPGAFKSNYTDVALSSPDIQLVTKSRSGEDVMGLHNTLIAVGVETGGIGLIVFLLIAFLAYRDFLKAEQAFFSQQDHMMRNLAIAGQAFIVTFMVNGLFSNNAFDTKTYWMILPLSIIFKRLSETPPNETGKMFSNT